MELINLYNKNNMKYFFDEKLIPGLIKSRPNRFIMFVEINGKTEKCHCPSTGRIGNVEIPCLLSKSKNKDRKTAYTVEAIYPEKNICVGINQTKANNYINFFLEKNLLRNMINVKNIKREVKLNSSRIDFFLNDNCFLEVKTLLIHMPFGKRKELHKFTSLDRLIRHFTDISNQLKKDQRAIVLLCYLYSADRFRPPSVPVEKVSRVVDKATKKGVENWQINLKVDKEGVSLIDYFKLNLFE